MIITLASLDLLWEQPINNLEQCRQALKESAQRHSDLVIFPEMTSTGFSVKNPEITSIDGMQAFPSSLLLEIAKYKNLSVVFGHIEKAQAYLENVLYAYDSTLELLHKYSKSHLFSYANEDDIFTSDNTLVMAPINKVKVGLAICYDLRFPELFRQYRLQGADACIVISNWPVTRKEHWFTLLKARAIENQMYMIGVNRTGIDGAGLEYEYSSVIFDPLGKLETPFSESGNLAFYDINLESVSAIRKIMPVILDIKTQDFGYKVSNNDHT